MSNSDQFYSAVETLKQLPPRLRFMALYVAMYWSDEKLELAEANGLLPFEDELKPKIAIVQ